MCPTRSTQGRMMAHQAPAIKVGDKDRLQTSLGVLDTQRGHPSHGPIEPRPNPHVPGSGDQDGGELGQRLDRCPLQRRIRARRFPSLPGIQRSHRTLAIETAWRSRSTCCSLSPVAGRSRPPSDTAARRKPGHALSPSHRAFVPFEHRPSRNVSGTVVHRERLWEPAEWKRDCTARNLSRIKIFNFRRSDQKRLATAWRH